MLEVKNISKIFKGDLIEKEKKALNQLSFKLRPESITGFLGHNGSGKTTLIKIVMGFIRATSGEFYFNEKMGKTKKEIFSNLGYLPERPYFYPHLYGKEFLKYMVNLSGKDWNRAQGLIKKYGEALDIEHAFNKKLKGYSKGMLQRIGFLTNIICEPKLIILDEPLSGLDPIGRKVYKDIITEVNNLGTTIFFSSHIVNDVEEVSDQLVVIEQGGLIYEGSLVDLHKSQEANDYEVKYYLNEKIQTKKIPESSLDEFLKEIQGDSGRLVEVSQQKPTLEQIVYQMKS